ncbi:MAG TPA: hypothetical protein VIN72_10085 [Lutibacter sp.]
MAINLKKIITVLHLNEAPHSQLETIILEYGSLMKKLNNPEQQSWFFIKAEENNLLKLKDLKNQFEKIRTDVNTATIDQLIDSFMDCTDKIKFIEINSQPGMIKGIALSSYYGKKAYLEELLEIKARVDEVKELDYYLINRKALIKLLGWKAL